MGKEPKIAVYPGSFDPVTNGHLDIIGRGRKMFDHLIVAVAANSAKSGMFTIEERCDLLKEVTKDMENVEVAAFSGLLVDYCTKKNAVTVVRGLRAVSDFDYEYAMFQMNREFSMKLDTLFLLASKEYSYLSSTILKEFARYGRSVTPYAPSAVNHALLQKFGHEQS